MGDRHHRHGPETQTRVRSTSESPSSGGWEGVLLLDRELVHYGPETKEARDLLRRYTTLNIDRDLAR